MSIICFVVLLYSAIISNALPVNPGPKGMFEDTSFSFEGTYTLRIAGEDRELSVCHDIDGAVFWGLKKVEEEYYQAVGRDPDGVQKYLPPAQLHHIYEAECDSFWIKETEVGVRTIQYYLRYNDNKPYSQRYTLSTATIEDDLTSIDNIYILQKVSDDVLGECFVPGKKTFDEIGPVTLRGPDLQHNDVGCTDECFPIEYWESSESACWALYEDPDFFDRGEYLSDGVQFEWDGKLRISTLTWPSNACCEFMTSLSVSEFDSYGNGGYVSSIKCVGLNFGLLNRYTITDDIGDCPLME